jgi:hypothetical protein
LTLLQPIAVESPQTTSTQFLVLLLLLLEQTD